MDDFEFKNETDAEFEARLKTHAEQLERTRKEKLIKLKSQTPLILEIEEKRVANERLDSQLEGINKEQQQKEQSFLVGEPKVWSSITEEENTKQWVWENYIAKGHITLLSALWKAGKSTLIRHLLISIHNEEEFAGQPTTKSRVLIISEENGGEWLSQKEDLEPSEIDHVYIWSRPIRVKPNLKQWVQFIQEITEYCLINNIDLVIIDTLSTFWPIDNENDSAQVLKALVPLYSFSENNIATLLVHHFRKGGGDQAQASRGSGALPGFVDNIIEFTRNDNGSMYQRVIKTYGRFDAVIPQVVIELTMDGKYKTLGEPWQVSKSARLNKIIGIFEESKLALSTKDVFNMWTSTGPDISLRSVQRYINELINKGVLSSVKTELVGKKEIVFYALKGDYLEQLNFKNGLGFTDDNSGTPLPMGAVVSSVNNRRQPLESLSPVSTQIVPITDDTTGISPKGNNKKREGVKTEWTEPDPRI